LSLLKFENVKKVYVMKPVIENFNLTVERGEVVRLEGPNGSGKTTIIKMACGLERPTSGKVLLEGIPPWKPKAKSKIGAVLHVNITYPDLTVRENLEFFSKLYKADFEFAKELAERVGLWDRKDQRASELSFGWRKRLELVRALLHKPSLVVLDEPFVGLDKRGREDVLKLLREALSWNSSIIYTSPTGATEFSITENERVVTLKPVEVYER